MIQNGITPILSSEELEDMGYKIAAYPLTILSAAVEAMQNSLAILKKGKYPNHITFQELQDIVGFTEYCKEEKRYTLT